MKGCVNQTESIVEWGNVKLFRMLFHTCDAVLFILSRSVCLDLVLMSMETGTTTGRITIWVELSDSQESMMAITSIMSPCCWQTSTRSKCLKADDTKLKHGLMGCPPNDFQHPVFFLIGQGCTGRHFLLLFPKTEHMNSTDLSPSPLFRCLSL